MENTMITSQQANVELKHIRFELELQISAYLDQFDGLEFNEKLNLHTGREKVDAVFEKDKAYHVVTTDNQSGEGLYYDLDDTEIAMEDLIKITEQIENKIKTG